MRAHIYLLAVCSMLALPAQLFCGQTSGVFLKLPMSPKAGGMGDAFSALADDSFGIHYNPAGIAYVKRPQLSLVYHKYVQDVSGSAVGFSFPLKHSVIGAAPVSFNMKEEPIYDAVGNDTGEKFGYSSKIFPVAVAVRFGGLALGFAGKSYSEEIDGESSATTLYDFGAMYRLGKMSFGASSQNQGGKIFDYEVIKVRRAGLAYSGEKYQATADIKKEGDAKNSFGFGGAYVFSEPLTFRGGWRLKDDFGGITFGVGIEFGALVLDYAYVSYGDLGATHKAGVTMVFGKLDKVQKPYNAPIPGAVQGVFKNSAPELSWTGEDGFSSGGISAGAGSASTMFMYRVKYGDSDGDAPSSGYPKLHILKSGEDIKGSPFSMEYVSGDSKDGAIYAFAQRLLEGEAYSYHYEASDAKGTSAAGPAVISTPGPIVVHSVPVNIPGGMNMAVAEFTGKNVSQADASIVTDFIRTELVGSGRFNVMDRANMDMVLAEQKFQNSGCTEQECAVEMGRLLNIKRIVVGSLSKLLDNYYVTVDLVDVETSKIISSYSSDAVSSKELKDACRKIVKNMVKK